MKIRSSRFWSHALGATLALALTERGLANDNTPADSLAVGDWAQCGGGLIVPPRPIFDFPPADGDVVDVESDHADLQGGGISTLTGNVAMERGQQQILADTVIYDEPAGTLNIEGNIQLWDEGLFGTGRRATHDIDREITQVEDATYILPLAHGRGAAESLVLESDDVIRVGSGEYTTCNPGDHAWILKAGEFELDQTTDTGTARNVWLELFEVPVFYTPYITFPISDKRKSGLLTPKFQVSDETGFDVRIPYYLNLHPQYDATLAVRPMSARGVQLGGEFRYLTRLGEGEIGGEILPVDARRDDSDREAFEFRHFGSFNERWSTDIDVNLVSDRDYFEDLGTNLGIASQSFLETRGDLHYRAPSWAAQLRLQGFRTLSSTVAPEDRPFQRLPQLALQSTLRERNRRLNFAGNLEVVNFRREAGVTGARLDLEPTVFVPLKNPGWFVKPQASLRYTQYALRDVNGDDSPSRLLPIASFDSGLFFERTFNLSKRSLTHTLEPRLFYLYVPFDGQEELPVFDTGEFDFNFSQLFRTNRFSGPDRQSDANQLTLALTTRILADDTGDELLRVSVGQTRFFRDPTVALPGEAVRTSSGSPVVADLSARLSRSVRVSAGAQYDVRTNKRTETSVAFRYQPDSRRVLNLAYRFNEDLFEQTDFSAAWPLARDWRIVGRWHYDLDRRQTLETFGGVEYESCCWAFRTLFRRYLTGGTDELGDEVNAVFFQLELKGLTGIGQSAVDFLERSIPGYENEF